MMKNIRWGVMVWVIFLMQGCASHGPQPCKSLMGWGVDPCGEKRAVNW